MGCFSDAVRADPGDLETDNNLPPSMSGSVLITALLRTSQAACAGSETRVLEPSARRSSFRERQLVRPPRSRRRSITSQQFRYIIITFPRGRSRAVMAALALFNNERAVT